MRRSVRVATLGFGRSSADLALVVFSLAATALGVMLGAPSMIRAPLAVVLIFFVPGYALTVALFPTGESSLTRQLGGALTDEGITLLDRLVISVGLSVSTVVLTGLTIDALPLALSAQSVLGALVALTVCLVAVALYRRRSVPAARRYTPFEASKSDRGVRRTDSRTLTILRVALALSLVFAGVALIQSGGATEDTGVTEFYVVAPSDAGELEANAYPVNLTAGEQRDLGLAVGNHEGQQVEYTVIGQRQQVDNGSGGLEVREREEIHRERLTLEAGETGTVNTTVSSAEPGQYRVVYLLYNGEPPAEPRLDNAAEEVHLWIDVDEDTAAADGR